MPLDLKHPETYGLGPTYVKRKVSSELASGHLRSGPSVRSPLRAELDVTKAPGAKPNASAEPPVEPGILVSDHRGTPTPQVILDHGTQDVDSNRVHPRRRLIE